MAIWSQVVTVAKEVDTLWKCSGDNGQVGVALWPDPSVEGLGAKGWNVGRSRKPTSKRYPPIQIVVAIKQIDVLISFSSFLALSDLGFGHKGEGYS